MAAINQPNPCALSLTHCAFCQTYAVPISPHTAAPTAVQHLRCRHSAHCVKTAKELLPLNPPRWSPVPARYRQPLAVNRHHHFELWLGKSQSFQLPCPATPVVAPLRLIT